LEIFFDFDCRFRKNSPSIILICTYLHRFCRQNSCGIKRRYRRLHEQVRLYWCKPFIHPSTICRSCGACRNIL